MSACNAGDPGLIPGSERSPGEGNGNPLQYSCLENPMDRGAWWASWSWLNMTGINLWNCKGFLTVHGLLFGGQNHLRIFKVFSKQSSVSISGPPLPFPSFLHQKFAWSKINQVLSFERNSTLSSWFRTQVNNLTHSVVFLLDQKV